MFLTVAANDGNQGAAFSQTAVLNLAPKAQHSERAWGNAPGWYGKGKPASAESAIQLLVHLIQPCYLKPELIRAFSAR
jgi:hypothetical protein